MPNVKRNGYKEYLETHIENAIFFDLDKNSDQMTDLPHMLTTSSDWEKIVSKMGILKDDKIGDHFYWDEKWRQDNRHPRRDE